MKLPIDGIQAFVQIDECGSFYRAADKLFITQTALTRRIQRLEAFIGVKLLDRTTRSTSLTPIGREFLPLAKRLVNDLTFGLDRLRTVSRLSLGDVTVATLQSVAFYRLPLAIRSYAKAFPGNRIRLLERSGSLVTEAVRNNHADFGIHILQDPQSDLEEELLMRDPFVLVCAREHPLAKSDQLAWSDLRGIDLITLGGASGNRRVVELQLGESKLEAHGRFVVESTPTAVALAATGAGAAILPATMTASIAASGLVEISLVEPTIYRSIGLVRRRNETLTPAAAAFYAIIKDELALRESILR